MYSPLASTHPAIFCRRSSNRELSISSCLAKTGLSLSLPHVGIPGFISKQPRQCSSDHAEYANGHDQTSSPHALRRARPRSVRRTAWKPVTLSYPFSLCQSSSPPHPGSPGWNPLRMATANLRSLEGWSPWPELTHNPSTLRNIPGFPLLPLWARSSSNMLEFCGLAHRPG